MKLLLTNDDGIGCEGLLRLAEELERVHEVWVMAPDSERSGTSHAMTLKTHTKIRKHGERRYSCSGMPADCVILSVRGVLPFMPDMVISGINRGANLGSDVIYSGTVAAARQASMMGIPGLAVSLVSETEPFHFGPAARFVADKLELLRGYWEEELFLNLNIPNIEIAPTAIRQARPCVRRYEDRIKRFDAPDGTLYCFLGECDMTCMEEEGTDAWAISRGEAALSRLEILPHHKELP